MYAKMNRKMNNKALTMNAGKGKLLVSVRQINDIPSLVIQPMKEAQQVGEPVIGEVELTDFPIVVHFYSVEGVDVWIRQLNKIKELLQEAEDE